MLKSLGTVFKQRSLQILLILIVYLFLAHLLPPLFHRGLYTLSLLIKDILMWMLPITVCLFMAHTIHAFKHKAPLFILTLALFETVSNFSSVSYAYLCGHIASGHLPEIKNLVPTSDFEPLWRLPLVRPLWWSADKGTFIGLFFGFLASFSPFKVLSFWIEKGRSRANWVLTRIFSRLIPLFVLGFMAKMQQTSLIEHMAAHYGTLIVWLILFLGVYMFTLFFLGNGASWIKTLSAIKNLLPAGTLALSSGCSISTMPWTIDGASKNLRDPNLAKAIIPATTNIQQIGDCVTNTFLCFVLYKNFFAHAPDIGTWLHFSLIFVLARFATAAVLGGAIFIMLPIYETYLNFNPEMIALILAFNVILDPLVTSSNVLANGALARVFENVWIRLQEKPKPTTEIT